MTILIILLVLVVLAFLGSLGLNLHFARRINNVNAREKGLDEIEEGYQSEIMDLEDRLESVMTSFHNMNNAALHQRMELRAQLEEAGVEKVQFEATIDDLKGQVKAYREVAVQKEIELQDVQQAALDMQIELIPRPVTDKTLD